MRPKCFRHLPVVELYCCCTCSRRIVRLATLEIALGEGRGSVHERNKAAGPIRAAGAGICEVNGCKKNQEIMLVNRVIVYMVDRVDFNL